MIDLSTDWAYTSAQNALALHGRELEAGLNLSVLISNPERKKGRTDHDADEREIHVSGLPRATKSDDLRKIFQEVRVWQPLLYVS